LPDASPEAISKSDFEAYQAQVAQFAQNAAQEIEELKRARAAAAPDPRAQAEANLPPDVDQKLEEERVRNPRRFYAELIGVAKKQARDEILSEVEQREQARAQQEAAGAFWSAFYGHNTDLQAWQGEVSRYFSQTDPKADPSARANWAADQVRTQLGEAAKQRQAQEERQKRGARQAAGAPGSMALPAMARDGAVDDGPERVTSKDALIDAMAEHEQHRAKRMWHNIDTPDYRAAARDRASRVVLKRSA
jgi:hypothetical protein